MDWQTMENVPFGAWVLLWCPEIEEAVVARASVMTDGSLHWYCGMQGNRPVTLEAHASRWAAIVPPVSQSDSLQAAA